MNRFGVNNHTVADDVFFQLVLDGFSKQDEETNLIDGCFFDRVPPPKKNTRLCVFYCKGVLRRHVEWDSQGQ
jgi:hypothetical protein